MRALALPEPHFLRRLPGRMLNRKLQNGIAGNPPSRPDTPRHIPKIIIWAAAGAARRSKSIILKAVNNHKKSEFCITANCRYTPPASSLAGLMCDTLREGSQEEMTLMRIAAPATSATSAGLTSLGTKLMK